MTEDTGQAGTRVGGRYELGELLGRGGMAEVRKGTDVRLGRTVAVKRLRTDLATDATFQARFRREAQSAAALNHPNIVSVYDTGEEMAADGTHVQPYIVMEFVAGRTLREVLNDGRKVLPERALEITNGILAALDYSHRAGIIHRDIKPANVMLTPAGDVKVMDFGIARAISDGTSTVTQTQAVVGTAQYLSPEQARGETVDSRSDVYSTGCVLFELLAGRPPFVGDSPFSVAYQHVREQPQPPSAYNPDVPPELDAIVLKSLAKRVENRYQSAAEMQRDIQAYLEGRPIDAPTAVGAPVPPPLPADSTSFFQENAPYQEEGRRRRRWPIILLVILVLALLAGAVALGLTLFASNQQVTTPDVSNMTVREADQRLTSQGLQLGSVNRVHSNSVPKGRIVGQDPTSGTQVDKGSSVDVKVSAGSRMVIVPELIGKTRSEAEQILSDAGLDSQFETQDSTQPKNQVIQTNPSAATSVPAGSTVRVILSSGPVDVPNVVGLSQSEATSRLQSAGFRVSTSYDSTTPSQSGTVLRQDPSGQAPRGSTVHIVVSHYTSPSPTPTTSPSPTSSPTSSPTGTGGTGGTGGGTGLGG
jgi:serine/threonine-protein kinase